MSIMTPPLTRHLPFCPQSSQASRLNQYCQVMAFTRHCYKIPTLKTSILLKIPLASNYYKTVPTILRFIKYISVSQCRNCDNSASNTVSNTINIFRYNNRWRRWSVFTVLIHLNTSSTIIYFKRFGVM